MARGYRPVRRDQGFLLPPDMADWLADDHLVWFVLDVVGELDTSGLHASYRTGGVGRAAYDPDMLLALVIYAWSQQVRSSRRIARLCEVDVAFRVICADDIPHHATISRFVAGCQDAVAGLFSQVLTLCARAGLVRLGLVALDGTKIAANASLGANRTRTGIEKELARLAADTAAGQVATDTAEDALFGDRTGDELPAELADPRSRRQRLRAALDQINRRYPAPPEGGDGDGRDPPAGTDRVAKAQAALDRTLEKARARHAEVQARRAAKVAARLPLDGRRPGPPEHHHTVRRAAASLEHARAAAAATQAAAAHAQAARAAKTHEAQTEHARKKANTTDPDSRIMPTRTGGWVQAYNAQLVATTDQIILAADITDEPNDAAQYIPMIDAAVAAAAALPVRLARDTPTHIQTAVADAGYWTPQAAVHPGPYRLIATANRHTLAARPTPTSPPDPHASALEQMTHRLLTPDGRATYKQRAATIEPVNGQIKDVTGLRRFRRRGRAAVHAELTLTATIHNLLKLHRSLPATS
jgi:transposase